jgi:hypothetical protein
LHLKVWMEAVKPFATCAPLVFDNVLSGSTVKAIADLQAKTDAAAAKANAAAVKAASDAAAAADKPPPAPGNGAAAVAEAATKTTTAAKAAPAGGGGGGPSRAYVSVTNFGFDSGEYNSPWVSLWLR